jgi:hypothetical protein
MVVETEAVALIIESSSSPIMIRRVSSKSSSRVIVLALHKARVRSDTDPLFLTVKDLQDRLFCGSKTPKLRATGENDNSASIAIIASAK